VWQVHSLLDVAVSDEVAVHGGLRVSRAGAKSNIRRKHRATHAARPVTNGRGRLPGHANEAADFPGGPRCPSTPISPRLREWPGDNVDAEPVDAVIEEGPCTARSSDPAGDGAAQRARAPPRLFDAKSGRCDSTRQNRKSER
jgi:hypothetical protein